MDNFSLDTVLSPEVFRQLEPLLRVSARVAPVNHRSVASLLEAVSSRAEPSQLILIGEHPGASVAPGLSALKQQLPQTPVVVIAMGTIQAGLAIDAMRRGAVDYLAYGGDPHRLGAHVHERLAKWEAERRSAALTERQVGWHRPESMIGDSPAMVAVFQLIDRVVRADGVTVLLQGETGTGKELVARALHYQSRRATAPFVEINCTAIPETLLESELFGYEKGAFTDAKHAKKGLLELADRGSLFLDEIGHMPIQLQAKLLRAIEEKRFRRVGGITDVVIDARIIAGTNVDLPQAIRDGMFREDLYYRLNVFTITIPPLRQREDDGVAIARHFTKQFSREYGIAIHGLTKPALALIRSHTWPGNVRELRHAIERAVLLSEDGWLSPDLFTAALQESPRLPSEVTAAPVATGGRSAPPAPSGGATITIPPTGITLAAAERQLIERTLALAKGNKTQAARMLDISRTRLLRILRDEPATPPDED